MEQNMKKRSSTFLFLLAVSTGATLLLGAVTGPANTKTGFNSDANASDVNASAPTEDAVAPPAKPSSVSKATPPARLSFGVDEVVKMHQSGVEADVIMNYV